MNLKKELLQKAEQVRNKKALELVQALKKATPVDTGNARDGWKFDGKSIVNDVDYIDDLNTGTSVQAPSYFIERTILADSTIKANGTIVTKHP
jgi:hypothetical protein